MRLFARRRDASPRRAPAWTEDQEWRLRETVRWVFAEVGRDVVVHADHAVDSTGRRIDLRQLVALCQSAPTGEWCGLVRAHVRVLCAPPGGLLPVDDHLEDTLRLRLVAYDDRVAAAQPTAARPVPELAEVLVEARAQAPALVDQTTLAGRPGDAAHWRQVARQGLVEHLTGAELEHQLLGWTPEEAFHGVASDQADVASMALVLPELLDRLEVEAADAGVLLAVPAAQRLGLRVVDGPDAALSLHHLFRFARTAYAEAEAGLSPHVFWVHDGTWTQVTKIEGKRMSVSVDEDLGEALGLGRE